MPQLRDGSTVDDLRLDRLPDPEDNDFLVGDVIAGQDTPVTTTWTIPDGSPVLDQEREGACVGAGCTNELRFNPVPVPGLDMKFAREQVYWPAQRDDQFPGGAYPGANPFSEGTSVRAGIKQLVRLGYVGEYRRARNEAEMALAITIGPIVIGVDWYEGMYQPNARGYLRPTGRKVGGHCVLLPALKVTSPPGSGYYTIYNSWGPNWGRNGTARISRADMRKLIDSGGGDAWIITSRYNPPQPR